MVLSSAYPQLSTEWCHQTGSQLRKYLLATAKAMRRNIFALYSIYINRLLVYLQRHLTSPFRFLRFVSVLWAKAACGCYQKSRWDLGASCVWLQFFFAGKRKAVWKKTMGACMVHAILVRAGPQSSLYEKTLQFRFDLPLPLFDDRQKNCSTCLVPWCSWFQVCRARRIPQGARGHGFFDENLEIYAGPSRGISLSFMKVCSKVWAPAANRPVKLQVSKSDSDRFICLQNLLFRGSIVDSPGIW